MLHFDDCFKSQEIDLSKLPIPSQEVSFALNIIFTYYLYHTSRKRMLSLSKLLSILGLFISGFFVTMSGKVILGDDTCSDRPNSVSSHTFFSIFFLLIWNHNFLMKHKKQSSNHFLLLLLTDVSLIATTLHTYFGGFHTLRQMYYGFLVAAAYYLIYIIISKILSKRNRLVFTICLALASVLYGIRYVSIVGFPVIIAVLAVIYTFLSVSNLTSFLRYTSQ